VPSDSYGLTAIWDHHAQQCRSLLFRGKTATRHLKNPVQECGDGSCSQVWTISGVLRCDGGQGDKAGNGASDGLEERSNGHPVGVVVCVRNFLIELVQESQWLMKLHTYGLLRHSFRPSQSGTSAWDWWKASVNFIRRRCGNGARCILFATSGQRCPRAR
jgi:hypothetical protein